MIQPALYCTQPGLNIINTHALSKTFPVICMYVCKTLTHSSVQSLIHFNTYSSNSILDLSHMTNAWSDLSIGWGRTFPIGHFLWRWLLAFSVWFYAIGASGLGLGGFGLWSLLWRGFGLCACWVFYWSIDRSRLGFLQFLFVSFWFLREFYGIWGLRQLGLCLPSFRDFCWVLLCQNLESSILEKS